MKYWIFDGKQAQGPYAVEQLKAVPGFGPETVVAPEGASSTDQWRAAKTFDALRGLFIKAAPLPPPPPKPATAPEPQSAVAAPQVEKSRKPLWSTLLIAAGVMVAIARGVYLVTPSKPQGSEAVAFVQQFPTVRKTKCADHNRPGCTVGSAVIVTSLIVPTMKNPAIGDLYVEWNNTRKMGDKLKQFIETSHLKWTAIRGEGEVYEVSYSYQWDGMDPLTGTFEVNLGNKTLKPVNFLAWMDVAQWDAVKIGQHSADFDVRLIAPTYAQSAAP
ncbi:MAG: hypothetical protein AAB320_01125 [Elusimicrobiota bacterium]